MSTVSPKVGSSNVSTSSVNVDQQPETKPADITQPQTAENTQTKPYSEGAKQARVAEHNLYSYVRQSQISAIPIGAKQIPAKAIDLQLMEAAKNNDLKKIEDLIKQGANVNSGDDKGRTPLMYAAQAGSLQAMESLVKKHHADVNAKDINDQTALMKSSIMGKNDGVKFLLDNKAKIDEYDKFGRTALTYSARADHTDVLKTLLHKGADPNIRDNDGRSPLMEAAGKGNLESTKELIKHFADVDAQTDRSKSTALMDAIDKGNPDVIRLLAKRSDPDLQDSQGNTALMHLTQSPRPFGVRDMETVQALIKNSKDVDIKNNAGQTALMAAGAALDNVTLKALIEHGADPNIQDKNGKTPLMHLIGSGSLSMDYFEGLNVLIPKTDLDLQDTSGRTALIQAAIRGDFIAPKILHSNGANLNIADNQGRTALMEAAQNGSASIVKILMDEDAASEGRIPRKADPFIRTGKRERALEIAERELRNNPGMAPDDKKKFQDIIDLLKKEMDI
jgi:ankyrin repeat protein